jgi:hypothetical protein
MNLLVLQAVPDASTIHNLGVAGSALCLSPSGLGAELHWCMYIHGNTKQIWQNIEYIHDIYMCMACIASVRQI